MPDWQLAVAFVFAIVIPILGVLVPFLMHINKSNEEAHRQIGKNIDGAREEIGKLTASTTISKNSTEPQADWKGRNGTRTERTRNRDRFGSAGFRPIQSRLRFRPVRPRVRPVPPRIDPGSICPVPAAEG